MKDIIRFEEGMHYACYTSASDIIPFTCIARSPHRVKLVEVMDELADPITLTPTKTRSLLGRGRAVEAVYPLGKGGPILMADAPWIMPDRVVWEEPPVWAEEPEADMAARRDERSKAQVDAFLRACEALYSASEPAPAPKTKALYGVQLTLPF